MISLYILIVCSVLMGAAGVAHAGELRKNFYKDSCPLAEESVKSITWKHVSTNSALPAKLLRMHFHDCFVRVRILAACNHIAH